MNSEKRSLPSPNTAETKGKIEGS
eukprot:COSAG02_NODE_62792_length_265_cov_0.560241_1_plen_23_part_10